MEFVALPVHDAVVGKSFDRTVDVFNIGKGLSFQTVLALVGHFDASHDAVQDVDRFTAGDVLFRVEHVVIAALHIAGSSQGMDGLASPRRNLGFIGKRSRTFNSGHTLISHIVIGNDGKFFTSDPLLRLKGTVAVAVHDLFVNEGCNGSFGPASFDVTEFRRLHRRFLADHIVDDRGGFFTGNIVVRTELPVGSADIMVVIKILNRIFTPIITDIGNTRAGSKSRRAESCGQGRQYY